MSAHTPGPWTWEQFSEDICYGNKSNLLPDPQGSFQGLYCAAEKRAVAVATDGSAYTASFINPDSADAHLIAAAPDLLAALEAVERSGTDCEGTPCCPHCGSGGMHDKGCSLNAALTKARGRSDD